MTKRFLCELSAVVTADLRLLEFGEAREIGDSVMEATAWDYTIDGVIRSDAAYPRAAKVASITGVNQVSDNPAVSGRAVSS